MVKTIIPGSNFVDEHAVREVTILPLRALPPGRRVGELLATSDPVHQDNTPVAIVAQGPTGDGERGPKSLPPALPIPRELPRRGCEAPSSPR